MKNMIVRTHFKRALILFGVFAVTCGSATAQFFNQTPEPPTAAALPPAPVAAEPAGERALPSIGSPRSDSARLRQQQEAQRTARAPGAGVDVEDKFSVYVETVTGRRLEQFGRSLFTNVPSTFAPLDSAQVNGEYVVGPGDEVQIRGWGMVNVDVTATVDRAGAIYIPRVGSVKVAGVKYRDLQGHLKQAVGRIFSNFELTASIAQTRALQIYVVGHAVRPGTYTLSSMSTLLNALFTSGGPSATGSMRNIQLKRGSSTIVTLDLYDILVKGDKSGDSTLRDGDVIYIPEVGPLVAVSGNVKSPAIFELKGTTSLADVLGWTGGVEAAADQKKIIVEKTVNNRYEMIAEVLATQSALESLKAVPVRPTDVLRVFSPEAFGVQASLQHEYVHVSGEVKQSGVIQIRKGETLRELMVRLGGVTESGYVFATQLKRETVKRNQQVKLDEIADRFERELESASRMATTIDKDALAIKAAELERQRRVAEKLRQIRAEGRIVLELDNGQAEVKNLPELALHDGDSIYVPRRPGTVEVLGSVFQSNSFIYKPRRSVTDYVTLAGGATSSADKSEMYLIRADGTASSGRGRWMRGLGGEAINPGDTVVVPEKIERSSWRQTLKDWAAIFYQFGLGAAGLKVLQN